MTDVPEPTLRRARPDEADAIGEVVVAAYRADGFLTLPDGSFDTRYGSWLADTTSRIEQDTVVVAVDDDVIVGTVTWCPYGSRSAELAVEPGQGEFRTLAVAPSARGRGIARALVGWCLDEARRTGLHEIWICSRDSMTPAHALYRSLGFERTPSRDWYPIEGLLLHSFHHDLTTGATGG